MPFLLDSHGGQSIAPSIQNMLAQYPGGAYTTLAIRNNRVLELQRHVRRLTRNVDKLHVEKGAFGRCLQQANAENSSLPTLLSGGLATMLSAAFAQWHIKDVARGIMTCAVCDDGTDAPPLTEGYTLPARVGICLHEHDSSDGTASEYSMMRAEVAVAVQVYVMGPPRGLPEVKNTEWPQQRHGWQSRLPIGAAEGLLWSHHGLITEGFVTNAFVVVRKGDKLLVQTAPEHMVLAGIVRSKVVDACNNLGLPLLMSPPNSAERATWSEAFVCNSLRQIQPIHRILCNGDDVWQSTPWEWHSDAVPGPVTAAIQAEVEQSWATTPISELTSCAASSLLLSMQ